MGRPARRRGGEGGRGRAGGPARGGAIGTLVLDFDSTLVDRETLDELLARLLAGDPARIAEVRAITDAGMEGKIPFAESLRRRLAIARPTRGMAEALGEEAAAWITPGLPELLAGVRATAWVVSGGLLEVVRPAAARAGVPRERVLATRVRWNGDGTLAGVDEPGEKVALLRGRAEGWSRPRILVGDGMTDYEPFHAGLVDRFVAFTLHARRAAVVATGAPEAASVRALEYLLAQWL